MAHDPLYDDPPWRWGGGANGKDVGDVSNRERGRMQHHRRSAADGGDRERPGAVARVLQARKHRGACDRSDEEERSNDPFETPHAFGSPCRQQPSKAVSAANRPSLRGR
jgi:hypothetical protein